MTFNALTQHGRRLLSLSLDHVLLILGLVYCLGLAGVYWQLCYASEQRIGSGLYETARHFDDTMNRMAKQGADAFSLKSFSDAAQSRDSAAFRSGFGEAGRSLVAEDFAREADAKLENRSHFSQSYRLDNLMGVYYASRIEGLDTILYINVTDTLVANNFRSSILTTMLILSLIIMLGLSAVGVALLQLRRSLRSSKNLADEVHAVNRSLIREIARRKRAENELLDISRTDPLTGLFNRRVFDESMKAELARRDRTHTPFSLLLIDVDCFKPYNDFYGHAAGDETLIAVASTLKSQACRTNDVVVRYGGEEFAIILPDTDIHGAFELAEHCRTGIESLGMPHRKSSLKSKVLTVSIGVAVVDDYSQISSADEIFESADKALYEAKRRGRNQVVGPALPAQAALNFSTAS